MKTNFISQIVLRLNYSTKVNKINLKKNREKLILIQKILTRNKNSIIKSISKDVGKSKKDALVEFNASINIWKYAINNIQKIRKNIKIRFNKKDEGEIIHKPIGLVAFITPWNYPLLTLSERLPFCLATGSTAIIKQSEYCKNFNNVLFKILSNKKYLFNTLHVLKDSNYRIGKYLCSNKNISAISFVGSSQTGKKILLQSSSTLKKTFLELGGKNSAIITKNADLKLSINDSIKGIFENGGQACVGISRLIIQKSIFKIFVKKLLYNIQKKYENKKLSFQIPANNQQRKKISRQISFIKKFRNKRIIKKFNFNSKKFTPIFLQPKKDDKYFINTEFFFPIVTIESFETLDEAIKINNKTDFGLATYIFTNNIQEKNKLSTEVNSGRIWHNSSLVWNPNLPVGGFGLSGQDRDMGIKGFDNYLMTKSIYKRKIYG